MALVPITHERFHDKQFRQPQGYTFSKDDLIVPIGLHEIPKVLMDMPIGIAPSKNGYLPVAVLGFGSDQNTFINRQGQWTGRYVPAWYRAHPFSLALSSQQGLILCIDEHSPSIELRMTAGAEFAPDDAQPFYAGDGQPMPWLHSLNGFLGKLHTDRNHARQACQCLADFGLLIPWSVNIQTVDGLKAHRLKGLHAVDEAALLQLSAENLCQLRDRGALVLAYAHLLSVQHLVTLREKAAVSANTQHAVDLTVSLDEPSLSYLSIDVIDP